MPKGVGATLEPRPAEFDFDVLPRKLLGGLKREAVEDLVRRMQWDYAQLVAAHRKLQESVEKLQAERSALVEKLHATPPPPPAPVPQAEPAPPMVHDAHELDRSAHEVLEAAYRRAREVREEARTESTLALRKAHEKVASLEEDYVRIRSSAEMELHDLIELVPQLQAQLRSVLHLVNARAGDATPAREHEDAVDRELLDVAIARDRPIPENR
jgi:hypothetical protein